LNPKSFTYTDKEKVYTQEWKSFGKERVVMLVNQTDASRFPKRFPAAIDSQNLRSGLKR